MAGERRRTSGAGLGTNRFSASAHLMFALMGVDIEPASSTPRVSTALAQSVLEALGPGGADDGARLHGDEELHQRVAETVRVEISQQRDQQDERLQIDEGLS